MKIGDLVQRPWGNSMVLAIGRHESSGIEYKLKILTLLEGKKTSVQKHYHRREYWVVLTGEGRAVTENDDYDLEPGVVVDVPVGHIHQIANGGKLPLVILELQHGSLCSENDIVRYDEEKSKK